MLFGSIVREDRNVFDMMTADYTFVNERLAKHYGIPNIYGTDFRRVNVPSSARKGLFGQGSFLTVTSAANRTSPVTRGAWILENLLGSPAPLPPPNVPPFPEKHKRSGHQEGCRHPYVSAWNSTAPTSPAKGAIRSWIPSAFRSKTSTASGVGELRIPESKIDTAGQLVDGTTLDGVESLRRRCCVTPMPWFKQ